MNPTEVRNDSPARLLHITWPDRTDALPYRLVRGFCPCAHCQGHGAGPKKFVENDAVLVSIKPVGHYALQLGWNDGHSTGLYTWEYLRLLTTLDENANHS